jgi:hypothetical protein
MTSVVWLLRGVGTFDGELGDRSCAYSRAMPRCSRRRSRRTPLGAGLRAERQLLVDCSDLSPADLEQRAAEQRAAEQRRTPLRRPLRPR